MKVILKDMLYITQIINFTGLIGSIPDETGIPWVPNRELPYPTRVHRLNSKNQKNFYEFTK